MSDDDPQTYAIIGAAMEVHGELGLGFLEAVYQEAMEVVMLEKKIPHEREKLLPIWFRNAFLKTVYKADFLVFGEIIVELKARNKLAPIDWAQTKNYMKATGKRRGLLLNFGAMSLEYERVVL